MFHRRVVHAEDNGHHHRTNCGCATTVEEAGTMKDHPTTKDHPPTTMASSAVTTTAASSTVIASTIQKPRIRRRKQREMVSLKNAFQTLLDEDLMISLVQVISVLILLGCGITLLNKWFSDGGSIFSLDFMGLGFLGKTVVKKLPGQPYALVPLTPSKYYKIPGSMDHIGDKSDAYALLRKEYDAKMKIMTREEIFTPEQYHSFHFTPISMDDPHAAGAAAAVDPQPLEQEPYDIYNCPDKPPNGYPYAWTLVDLLNHWGPDNPEPPSDHKVFQGLCVFDYEKDYDKALTYQEAELPFVIQNDPEVHNAVYRWNQPNYLYRMLGPSVKHRAEHSANNHFMYWQPPPSEKVQKQQKLKKKKGSKPWQQDIQPPQGWEQPTTMLRITYSEWLEHANVTDESLLGPDQPHWYFRLIGCGETGPEGQCDSGSSEYLFDELTFFQPKESLYMVHPEAQKGIHCRFGMKGVIAENHFDGSRNMIAVMGGARRYILAHPDQCPYLSLLPKGHPSARHSAVDWSNPDLDSYPEFAMAKGNEVVLQAGDVLYLPTNWFHYIISMTLNYQCNTRSGISQEYMAPIHQCGF